MKIGFFTDSYFPEIDGVTYTLKSWKDRLEDQGHDVYIIYPESDKYNPENKEIPVKSVSNPFYPGYNIPIPINIGEMPEFDIIHCHTPFGNGRVGKRIAKKRKIPAVYTHHTPVEEYFEQNTHSKILAKIIEKIYLPFENSFLAGFDEVTSSTGDLNRKVDPIELPVGVDIEFFNKRNDSFIEDLDLNRPVIGYSGRISIEKNVDHLITMAEKTGYSTIIVGEGPKKPEIEESAPDNVKFFDFLPREELPEFYSGIDLFVTASTGDTLGLSTLEANACGTPVVAPDVKPFNNTIMTENGERYAKNNLEEMQEKIELVLNNSKNPREYVKNYSLKKSIQRLENLYQDLKTEK